MVRAGTPVRLASCPMVNSPAVVVMARLCTFQSLEAQTGFAGVCRCWPGSGCWAESGGGTGRPLRSADARTASTVRTVARTNTTIKPCWQGPEIRSGKNSRPVMICWAATG